jgi:glycosyltransferase involved in cell wall biosynthesis
MTTKKKEKLNIGIFVDAFFPYVDGVVNVIDNYAKCLSSLANVYVFAPNAKKGYTYSDKYTVVPCKGISLPFLGNGMTYPLPAFDRKFNKMLEGLKLDIVHFHSPFGMSKVALRYGKKHNVPVIATFHSQFKRDFKQFLRTKGLVRLATKSIIDKFDRATETWTFSDACKNTLLSYGYNGDSVYLLPNGTDRTPLTDEELLLVEEIDNKYELSGIETVFITVGRLYESKNTQFSLRALAKLKERGITNFKYLIVGVGDYEKPLRKLVEEYKLTDNVIFTGLITDRKYLSALLCRADLFLFPSYYDMSSLVQVEAACYSTPVVFLKGANTASTVTNDVNGFVLENNIDDYANKIMELMTHKDTIAAVGQKAHEDLYITWEDISKRVYKRYNEVIKKFNSRG